MRLTVALDAVQDAMKVEWKSHGQEILCEFVLRCWVEPLLPIHVPVQGGVLDGKHRAKAREKTG